MVNILKIVLVDKYNVDDCYWNRQRYPYLRKKKRNQVPHRGNELS
jgi:hypothetical protein